MKKIMLVLTVALFVVNAYSQNSMQNEYEEWKPSQDEYSNFDLGKYITPDIVRNQLDIDFYLNGGHSRFDDSHSGMDNRLSESSSRFAGNITSSFSHYVNTRKKISSVGISLSFEENYNSQKEKRTFMSDNSTIEDKNVKINSANSLYLDWSNKWYFSKLIFMEYNIYGSVSYDFAQDKINNQSEDSNEKHKSFSVNISPQLGIGYGRIENVQDARQAVYIANALSKRKVLTRNLSNEELFELSQKISTVKNKRFLDSRLHLMDEITSVDSFFVSHNLLADNGAAYFTTLYDMWQYGDLFPRRSGYEISLVAHPDFNNQHVKYTPMMRNITYNSNQYTISLDFRYEKPFKLNWQHSVAAGGYGSFYSSSQRDEQTDNTVTYDNDGKTFSAFANYSLGYYPNTRTNIRVGVSQQISKNIVDDWGNSMNSSTSLSANLYYYFSPNLRLTGNCWLMYAPSSYKRNEGDNFKHKSFSSPFSLQLTYLIF